MTIAQLQKLYSLDPRLVDEAAQVIKTSHSAFWFANAGADDAELVRRFVARCVDFQSQLKTTENPT